MTKTKDIKKIIITSYLDKLNAQKSTVIASFKGLTVKELEELRKNCRDNKIDYIVAKKTLLEKALKEKGLNGNVKEDELKEGIGVAFGKDEVSPAKVLSAYSKNYSEKFKVVFGILEGKSISLEQINALADLPAREELLAKVLGSINSPISNFVNVLQGNLRGLINVLNAIKENK